MVQEDKIIIKNSEGVTQEFYKLIEFIDKKTNKDFIVYTDNQYENNKLNIYSNIVEKGENGIKLLPVANEDDREKVKKALLQVKISLIKDKD